MFLQNRLTRIIPLLIILMFSSGVLFANSAALDNGAERQIPSWDGFVYQSQQQSLQQPQQQLQQQQFRSVIQPVKWAKKSSGNTRSKAEVVKQVKQRYNAKVLRISLNSRGDTYNVRILMPSGKMRDIQVSAQR